ncbi:tetraspanin-33-like isoform X1 [Argiope bruennichi]|nr:tetraspanin-33-like isoform X1 [Argiope bruennichi]
MRIPKKFLLKVFWKLQIHGPRRRMNGLENLLEDSKFANMLRNALYTLNWLFLVSSALTLVIGLYLYWKFELIQILIDVNFNPDLYVIGLSILLFITGFVGYIAVSQRWLTLLYWYVLALMLLLLIYIPTGSASFALSMDRHNHHRGAKELWVVLHNYHQLPMSTRIMDEIQAMLQCCGISKSGYKDWDTHSHFQCADNFSPRRCSVPPSCCKHPQGRVPNLMCGAYVLNNTIMPEFQVEKVINTRGCLAVLDGVLKRACTTLGFMSFVTASVVLLTFVLTILFIKTMDEKPKEIHIQNYIVDLKHDKYMEAILNPGNDRPVIIAAPKQNSD